MTLKAPHREPTSDLMYDKGNPMRGLLVALLIEAVGVVLVFGVAWLLACAVMLI